MGPSPPHVLRGTEASRMVLIREGPEIFQHLVLALELFHLLLEPDDPVVFAGLRRSVAGESGFRHLVVFGGPSSQGRILDAEPFGEALRRHLSREHDFGCRDLEPLVVAFPSSGHIEHLSPLTWCPIYLTLSTLRLELPTGRGADKGDGGKNCPAGQQRPQRRLREDQGGDGGAPLLLALVAPGGNVLPWPCCDRPRSGQ